MLLEMENGYVSFLSAMNLRGLINQIPRRIHVATSGAARLLVTPIGTYEFFQLKPAMLREAIDWSDTKVPYRLAMREKALLDTLYLSTRKGKRFAVLPEVHLDEAGFDELEFERLLQSQVPSYLLKVAIHERLAAIK